MNNYKSEELNKLADYFGKPITKDLVRAFNVVVDTMSDSKFDYVVSRIKADESRLPNFPKPAELDRLAKYYRSGAEEFEEKCYFCDSTGWVLALTSDNTQVNYACKCSRGQMLLSAMVHEYPAMRGYFEIFPDMQFEDPKTCTSYNDVVLFEYWKGVAMKSNKTEGNLEIKEVLKKYPNANTDLPF